MSKVEINRSERQSPMEWFGEVKQEVKKITWTTKEELILFTKVTVGMTFAVGLGIYLVDLLIQSGLSGVSALVKAIIS